MQIWAFDCEWAPDLASGRRVYHLPDDLDDGEVMRAMWEASPDFDRETNPQPFLKTILCRLVSIAAVVRTAEGKLALWTAPSLFPNGSHPFVDDEVSEREILSEFLGKFEQNLLDAAKQPTLVGYNSRNSDLHILYQRALVNGLQLRGFNREVSAKPWNQTSVDLMDMIGGKGRGYGCSLNEIALLCGIPGKLDTTGDDVAALYYGGRARKVVEYNVFDALTTYLLWLRCQYFAGDFSAEEYAAEQNKVRDLVAAESAKPHGAYLSQYVEEWERLSK